jgi:glycosyltransferase involved in cell wall biosynthesis
VKVALVTTPPSVRSGIGDYTRHLLPYLREHDEVEVFVEHGVDEPAWAGERARLVRELDPRRFDQVLFQLGNERAHAFMPRMIRAIGGTVALHDWVLFDLAMAAWPALPRGGAKGHALALREGGLRQTQVYVRNWLDRRRQRTTPMPPMATVGLPGGLLFGWHAPEAGGRWTTDFAGLRIPSTSVERVRFEVHLEPGRTLRVHAEGRVLAEERAHAFEVRPARPETPELVLETIGVQVTPEQRKHGDARRLGCVVRRVAWTDEAGEHELDLAETPAVPLEPISLSRDRFDLALNRSVVRFADAFICHSRYVAERVRSDRNAETPLGILPHGSVDRWREGDRAAARRALGLPEDWARSFLVVSFGGVQPHKRIDKVLQGLARARRERSDIRLILAGSIQGGGFDPQGLAKALGLGDAVRFTGYLPETEAWDWLHAGDIAINLRGPTTGGTSGGIFQAFSMGRSVIATAAAEQTELPKDTVVHVPLGDGEVEALGREFVALRDDPARRARLEERVRAYVTSSCHWRVVARQYHDYLASFPRTRASRRKLVALRVGLQRSAL